MRLSFGIFIGYFVVLGMACSHGPKMEKGYAYARNILSGAKPGVTLFEDGTVVEKPKSPQTQYFIYTQTKNTKMPEVKNIRIKGISYSATVEKVSTFPVTLQTNANGRRREDTLVASPVQNLWKINVGEVLLLPAVPFKDSAKLLKSPVFIGFMHNGKLHYYPIADLKFLEPVALE